MTPLLYAHPFSSYCQKVLVALYETGTPFELRRIDDEAHMAELAARWPLRRFPILVDGERTVLEASTIIGMAKGTDGARKTAAANITAAEMVEMRLRPPARWLATVTE